MAANNRVGAIKAMGLVLLLIGVSLSGAFLLKYSAGGVARRAEYHEISVKEVNTFDAMNLFYSDMMRLTAEDVLVNNLSMDLDDFCPYQVDTGEMKAIFVQEGEKFVLAYQDYEDYPLPHLIKGEEIAEIIVGQSEISVYDESTETYTSIFALSVYGTPLDEMNITGIGRVISSPGTFSVSILQTSETLPDLVPKKIRFSKNKPKKGDDITVYVTVENMGCDSVLPKASTGGDYFNVSFHYADSSVGYILNETTWENGLAVGQQAELELLWPNVPNGTFTVTATVDSYPQQITELKEDNNKISKDITVT